MMSYLKINTIVNPSPKDPDLKAIQDEIGPVISVLLDENIKRIEPTEPLTVHTKRSFRLNFETGLQLEIGMADLSSRRLFKGLFKLAKKLEQDVDSKIQQILPVTPDLPELKHARSMEFITEAGHYQVVLKTSQESFVGLGGVFSDEVEADSHCPDFLVPMDLFIESLSESSEIQAYGAGWVVKGNLNEFGDLVVKELNMSDEAQLDGIRADIKIGSIYLNLRDLLNLKPGSSIEIDWPEDSKAALLIGNKPWTQVKIKVDEGKISLILPEDATFPS